MAFVEDAHQNVHTYVFLKKMGGWVVLLLYEEMCGWGVVNCKPKGRPRGVPRVCLWKYCLDTVWCHTHLCVCRVDG